MKKDLLSLVFISVSCLAFSQNLVPNPSFETYSVCPAGQGEVTDAIGWQKALNNNIAPSHADYMNACAPSGNYSTPNNVWGIQTAATGNAYMALTTMCTAIATDYRENFYIQLTSPLVIGNTYSVSFKASLADDFQFSSTNLGAKFSTVPSFLINNFQQIGTGAITSQTAWTPVTGTFVADSAYKYVAIGNFHQDAFTTQATVCSSCPQPYNLYFIDDVSVTLFATTGIKENSKNSNISIYPNPSKGVFSVSVDLRSSLIVSNCLGQIVLKKELDQQLNEINMNNFNSGLYFVSIETNGKTEIKKLIIE